jgi:hypothetical protein
MKLNMVNGAAYLIEPVEPIVRGGEGASRIVLTKDRPGSVKPDCARLPDPAMRYAGMLTVKSSGDGPGDLQISIIPPQPVDANGDEDLSLSIPPEVMESVSRLIEEKAGPDGMSRKSIRAVATGKHARKVGPAIEELLREGYLEEITERKVSIHGGRELASADGGEWR